MKCMIASAVLMASISASALAQPGADPAAAGAAVTAFSIDSPIEQLVANPSAKAVLDADFPGLTAHPAYEQFKSLSLKQLAPYSNGVITDEKIAKAATDLASVK